MKKDKDDDMLNYLKYSPLDDIPEEDDIMDDIVFKNKATQFPELKHKRTQTERKPMNDKETDTYDELNKMEGKYILQGKNSRSKSKEVSRGELMTQVNSIPVAPSDSENSGNGSDDSGFLVRNARRGFRLAEFAMNSAITTANITASLADALVEMSASNQNDNEENNNEDVISVHSSPPISVSSSSGAQTISSSASSIPVPTSPQSSRASSKSSSRSGAYPKKH